MASEWRLSTWGDEISLEYGKALRGYDATTGKYRVFGSNGPIGWTSQPLAPGPGVILSDPEVEWVLAHAERLQRRPLRIAQGDDQMPGEPGIVQPVVDV